MYAIFIIGGAFGGGNMFQANQSYELFGKLTGIPSYLYGIILATLVGFVIIGGIKRIGETTEKIVPSMIKDFGYKNVEQVPKVVKISINRGVGEDSKIIFSGDYTQSDLVKSNERNGVLDFMKILQSMPSFDMVEFGIEDIVRSGLVKEYLVSKINMGM